MKKSKGHTFHIPVMGTGFTIDTPLKVAHLGISSVISIIDDVLVEKMRKYYSEKMDIPFKEISTKIEDFRAKRITAYLNLVNDLVRKKFSELKNSHAGKNPEISKYFDMLPDYSTLQKEFQRIKNKYSYGDKLQSWIEENLRPGGIDVNIMTKVDKTNYNKKKEKLTIEHNDAHAALRGFAMSDLDSSIIFSAGMNPRLYGYMEHFEDFYPDETGYIKKKIVIKVSDYRSALIQGKFLAKKGLWVSEFRLESGLNCGGHAFASDGYLMGPILQEFKENRAILQNTLYEIFTTALTKKDRSLPEDVPSMMITAQGGVGTSDEHEFLMENYGLDSVGWATPFLLVPEAVNVDKTTEELLLNAREDDLYLSKISPLGVPFNTIRGNTKDIEKETLVEKGNPGSSCPKKYLKSNTEFTDLPICTASRKYQNFKIVELKTQNLSMNEFNQMFKKITNKACLCLGLGTSVQHVNKMDLKADGDAVSICPGPNMAYFSKITSLKKMVDHIYGKINIIDRTDRPHMFIKELTLYVNYLVDNINELHGIISEKQVRYFQKFRENLLDGIKYYHELFSNAEQAFQDLKIDALLELEEIENTLYDVKRIIERNVLEPV